MKISILTPSPIKATVTVLCGFFFIYLFNYFLPKHIRHLFYHPSSYKSSSYQSPWMALCLWPLHRANGKSNFAKRLKLIAHLRDACPIKWIQFIRGDLSLLHKFIFTSAVIDEDRYDYSICSKCARLTALSSQRVSVSLVLSLWLLRCELIDMSVSGSEDITGIY